MRNDKKQDTIEFHGDYLKKQNPSIIHKCLCNFRVVKRELNVSCIPQPSCTHLNFIVLVSRNTTEFRMTSQETQSGQCET